MLLIPFVYIAAVLQTWIAPRCELSGAVPNLLALTAFTWLITNGGPRGFLVTALVGLVSDLGSSTPLGFGIAMYAIVGYGAIWLRRHMNADRLPGQMGVLWLAITAITLSEGMTALCLHQAKLTAPMLLEHTILAGLFTTISALPIFVIINWRRARHRPMELAQASMV